jgi:hypothetical protein
LLECTIFLIKRIQKSSEGSQLIVDENGTVTLLKELFSRVWIEISNQRLKLEERTLTKLIPQALGALVDLDRIFFDAAWEALAAQMRISSKGGGKDAMKLVSVLLKALIDGSSNSNTRAEDKNYVREMADNLLQVISRDEMERIESVVLGSSEESTTNSNMIEEILEQFREGLFLDQNLASVGGIRCVVESISYGDPDRDGIACFLSMPSRCFRLRRTCCFPIFHIEMTRQGA